MIRSSIAGGLEIEKLISLKLPIHSYRWSTTNGGKGSKQMLPKKRVNMLTHSSKSGSKNYQLHEKLIDLGTKKLTTMFALFVQCQHWKNVE